MANHASDRAGYLWDRYVRQIITEIEYFEMMQLIQQHPEWFDPVIDAQLRNDEITHRLNDDHAQMILQQVLQPVAETPVRKMNPWIRWAVAASIVLLLGLTGYFIWNRPGKKEEGPVVKTDHFKNDIKAPDKNKATITTGEGNVIALDQIKAGTIVEGGNKVNADELLYQGIASQSRMLTLTVPRGSRPVKLTLSDGTKVWLNAGSSLQYPTLFVNAQREVTMTGEAYFEVAKNGKKFIVLARRQSVEVLGTHFNIKAYEDEQSVLTTLLEGSVKVNETIIRPGEQSVLQGAGISVQKEVDIEEVMAWKDGLFRFKNADIETIMRDVGRWYDVDVRFEGKKPTYGFVARKISRDEPVSELLKLLELTGYVHFRIEGRTITVMP
jgi:hypothetical protein